jgi:NADH:flavin oxidoreductase / NADH oxidase family
VPGRAGVLQGTTWGDRDGFPAVTRLRIGQHASQDDLRTDWILTHEFVHTALPSLPDDQHWLEEGIATYVEPIARYQSGFLTKKQVWWGMLDGMPHGEPGNSDRGLDYTHTWGRTYWGGALFCMVADISIRQQTKNALGLQDALAAIVHAHGSIQNEWPIERVLAVADKRTGTTVLEDLYKSWRATPVKVDLVALWSQLGVSESPEGVLFDDSAPLASVRDMILHPWRINGGASSLRGKSGHGHRTSAVVSNAEACVSVPFDGVEIHAADGDWSNLSLRTETNQRTDESGGIAGNRIPFLKVKREAAVRFSLFTLANDASEWLSEA